MGTAKAALGTASTDTKTAVKAAGEASKKYDDIYYSKYPLFKPGDGGTDDSWKRNWQEIGNNHVAFPTEDNEDNEEYKNKAADYATKTSGKAYYKGIEDGDKKFMYTYSKEAYKEFNRTEMGVGALGGDLLITYTYKQKEFSRRGGALIEYGQKILGPVWYLFKKICEKIVGCFGGWNERADWYQFLTTNWIKIVAVTASIAAMGVGGYMAIKAFNHADERWKLTKTLKLHAQQLRKQLEESSKKLVEIITGKDAINIGPMIVYYKEREVFMSLLSSQFSNGYRKRDDSAKPTINHQMCIHTLDKFFLENVGALKVKNEYLTIYENVIRMEKEQPSAQPKLAASLNFMFVGNPGTGKTSAVATLAKLLRYSQLRPAQQSSQLSLPDIPAPSVDNLKSLQQEDKQGVTNLISSTLTSLHAVTHNSWLQSIGTGMTFQAAAHDLIENYSTKAPDDVDTLFKTGSLKKGLEDWQNYEVDFWNQWTSVAAVEKSSSVKMTSAVEILLEDKPAAAFKSLTDSFATRSGVIFIDEAYSLDPANSEKGRQVYDIMLLAAENYRKTLTFILAGYKEDIERTLIAFNPGLARRFPRTVLFEDLKESQIRQIIKMQMRKSRNDQMDGKPVQGWIMSEKTLDVLTQKIVKRSKQPNFGNFATVLQYLDKAIMKAQSRYPQMTREVECLACKKLEMEERKKKERLELEGKKSLRQETKEQTPLTMEKKEESRKTQGFQRVQALFCPEHQLFSSAEAVYDGKVWKDSDIIQEGKEVWRKKDAKPEGDSLHESRWLEIKIEDIIGPNPKHNTKLQKIIKNNIGKQGRIWPGTRDEPKGVTAKRITLNQIVLDTKKYETQEVEKSMEIRWRDTGPGWNNIGTVNRWEKRSKTVTLNRPYPDKEKWPINGEKEVNFHSNPEIFTGGTYVGMQNIKKELQQLVDVAVYNWQQESEGYPTVSIMLNKIFVGKPGTGKTSIAQAWGAILKELNMLSDGSFIEKTASDFIGNVVGGSQVKTNSILKSAAGKVLFIDEAYVLAESDFGLEVLNTIVEQIQAKPGADISVVMAGYEHEMYKMCREVNPGLGRRFDAEHPVIFYDYSDEELGAILDWKAATQHINILPSAHKCAVDYIVKKRPAKDFGNAGTVENFLNSAVKEAMSRCLARKNKFSEIGRTDFQQVEMTSVPTFKIVSTSKLDEYAKLFDKTLVNDTLDQVKANEPVENEPVFEEIKLMHKEKKSVYMLRDADPDRIVAQINGNIAGLNGDDTIEKLLKLESLTISAKTCHDHYVAEDLRINRDKTISKINNSFKSVINAVAKKKRALSTGIKKTMRKAREETMKKGHKLNPSGTAKIELAIAIIKNDKKYESLPVSVNVGAVVPVEGKEGKRDILLLKNTKVDVTDADVTDIFVVQEKVADGVLKAFLKQLTDDPQKLKKLKNLEYSKLVVKYKEAHEIANSKIEELEKGDSQKEALNKMVEEKKTLKEIKTKLKSYENIYYTKSIEELQDEMKNQEKASSLDGLGDDMSQSIQRIQTMLRRFIKEGLYVERLKKISKKAIDDKEEAQRQVTEEMKEKSEKYTEWRPGPLTIIKQDFGWTPDYNPVEKLKQELGKTDDDPIIRFINAVSDEYKTAKLIWPNDRQHWPTLTNMIFNGNSGTGKTVTSNYMAEAFQKVGLMALAKTTVRSASELEGTVVGEAQELVQKAMEEALGGILLIDEAYELGKSEYGRQAQTKLIAMLEEEKFNKGKVVVILCGYKKDMRKMLKRNQGMASRFGKELEFEDMLLPTVLKQINSMATNFGIDMGDKDEDVNAVNVQYLMKWFSKHIMNWKGWGNFRDCKTLANNIRKYVYADAQHHSSVFSADTDKEKSGEEFKVAADFKLVETAMKTYDKNMHAYNVYAENHRKRWLMGDKGVNENPPKRDQETVEQMRDAYPGWVEKPKIQPLFKCSPQHIILAFGTMFLARVEGKESRPSQKTLAPNDYTEAMKTYTESMENLTNDTKKLTALMSHPTSENSAPFNSTVWLEKVTEAMGNVKKPEASQVEASIEASTSPVVLPYNKVVVPQRVPTVVTAPAKTDYFSKSEAQFSNHGYRREHIPTVEKIVRKSTLNGLGTKRATNSLKF